MSQLQYAFVLLLPLLMTCAAETVKPEIKFLKPSRLNEQAQMYDSKTLSIRGWAVIESGIAEIWDSRQSYEKDELTKCVSLVGMEKFTDSSEYNKKQIVVTGKFARDVFDGKVKLNVCSNAGLRVTKLRR